MFITRCIEKGIDVKVIAQWQGHQDGGQLIMDTYTEVFGGDDEEYVRSQLAKIGGEVPTLNAVAQFCGEGGERAQLSRTGTGRIVH